MLKQQILTRRAPELPKQFNTLGEGVKVPGETHSLGEIYQLMMEKEPENRPSAHEILDMSIVQEQMNPSKPLSPERRAVTGSVTPLLSHRERV